MKYKSTESVARHLDDIQSTAPAGNTPKAQAREWLTYLYSGHATSEKREEFVLWLNSNKMNQQAFTHYQQIWQTIGMTDSAIDWITQHANQDPVAKIPHKPKRILAKSAVLLSGIAASVSLLIINGVFHTTNTLEIITPDTVFTSSIGQNRTITLSDGSDVTLAGNSSIAVDIDQNARRITLHKGSAYFDVTHDPARVFSVTAQHTQVRVRGTAFEVKRSTDNAVKISVQRGLVDVADMPEHGNLDEKVLQLHANEQLRANIDGTFISDVTQFNPETEFAWLNERLIYDNTALKSVIMDINRYKPKPVVILDKSINDLPITASFTFNQIDQMLAGLVAAYPITLIEEDTRTILAKK